MTLSPKKMVKLPPKEATTLSLKGEKCRGSIKLPQSLFREGSTMGLSGARVVFWLFTVFFQPTPKMYFVVSYWYEGFDVKMGLPGDAAWIMFWFTRRTWV